MSYDSSNVYFADNTFDLTDLNYNPATGTTHHQRPGEVRRHHSADTELVHLIWNRCSGARPDDGLLHVVHGGFRGLRPFHGTGAVTNLTLSSVRTGAVQAGLGDYVVYWLKALTDTNGLEVNVTPTGAGGFDLNSANLLVYNNGNLMQY